MQMKIISNIWVVEGTDNALKLGSVYVNKFG